MRLALFPLPNLVLLPGMLVPLYIFEPRYRDLLKRVQHRKEPFGIVRIKTEVNAREPELRISRVGTLAHVLEVETHADGTSSILVLGGERFFVDRFDPIAHEYLIADVHLCPLEPSPEQTVQTLSAEALERFLNQAPQDLQRVLQKQAPASPLHLASYVASNLKLPPLQMQLVLEAISLQQRYECLLEMMPALRILH